MAQFTNQATLSYNGLSNLLSFFEISLYKKSLDFASQTRYNKAVVGMFAIATGLTNELYNLTRG